MKPGIYDITNEEYHRGAGISRSAIMSFKKTPRNYHYEYVLGNKEQKETDAFTVGNAFHTYVLEPHLFNDRYHIWEKVDGRKPASNTDKWKAIAAMAGERKLLCADDVKNIKAMNDALKGDEIIASLISGAAYEKSLFWTDKDTGLLCKVRPDILHDNMVADLKSASSAAFRDFQNDIFKYGYHIQAAMIHEALFALHGVNIMKFLYIVCEKDDAHDYAVYELSEAAIHKGIEEFKKVLFEIKDCQLSGQWPSYPLATIDLPAYAYSNKGEL